MNPRAPAWDRDVHRVVAPCVCVADDRVARPDVSRDANVPFPATTHSRHGPLVLLPAPQDRGSLGVERAGADGDTRKTGGEDNA